MAKPKVLVFCESCHTEGLAPIGKEKAIGKPDGWRSFTVTLDSYQSDVKIVVNNVRLCPVCSESVGAHTLVCGEVVEDE